MKPFRTRLAALLAAPVLASVLAVSGAAPASAAGTYISCPTGTLSQLNGKTEITAYIIKAMAEIGVSNRGFNGVVFKNSTSDQVPLYDLDTRKLQLRVCEPRTVIAHELGHWIDHKAAGFNKMVKHYQNDQPFLQFPDWRTWAYKVDTSGAERAASCIGYWAVSGRGFATTCPYLKAQQMAQSIIRLAKT